jgi:2-haloacid dehalogenase
MDHVAPRVSVQTFPAHARAGIAAFKPDPDVYAYALSELDEEPERVALIAIHPWDLAGAAHGGMRTAWVRHRPRVWPSVFPSPEVQADTLTDLATAILAYHW